LTDRRAFAHQLFIHLKNLQATHRHMLTMFLRNVELAQENIQLKQELSAQQETGGIIGKSAPLLDLLSLIRTIAPSDTTVLVTGETGTGKELAARLIHQLSRRKDRRFVAVNCGALPETLLESELFGHEKGSFTGAVALKKGKFELAEGGTLFLDEIGDISPAVQVKLLRVLQEREFQRVGGTSDLKANIRLIAATNRDLLAMMEQKQFRQDLFYRLNVIQLYVPALRERPEDIADLAQHFVQRFAEKSGKSIAGLTPDTLRLCLSYKWPGNIRELENVMERAVTLAPEGKKWITPDLLPNNLRSTMDSAPSVDITELIDRIEWGALLKSLGKSGSLTELLNHVEWSITRRAVAEYGGNKSRAAKVLGRTYRWLRKLETEMTEHEPPLPPSSPL
jgi:transcriptional regulator with PAS, ATPase and Fis domain